MARALATRPRVILLDEVLAGLNPSEMQPGAGIDRGDPQRTEDHHLLDRARDGGHHEGSDRIIVLDQGRKIREGKSEEVVSDPRVIEAYLGEADA